MDKTPRNPYVDLPLKELSDALVARAAQLHRGDRVGRRDVSYLLGVASSRLDPRPWDMSGPVYATEQRVTSLANAFWEYYEMEARSLRYAIIRRALELVPEVVPGKPGYDPILSRGYMTEAGLREVLERFGRDRQVALAAGEVLPGKAPPEPAAD